MTSKNSRLFGSLNIKLLILALFVLGLGLAGCSEEVPTGAPVGGNDNATGVFRGSVDDEIDFEFISTKNGDPENPIEGPFAIRGRNIRYDSDMGALIVDLSVENLGENTFDEVITLTFLSLLPDGVTVLNPDNGENGAGASIDFEFENDDGQWTPGEESLLRETHFQVAEGVSIGFVARLDTGTGGGGLGSIGGMVWNDANGDGIMDEDEAAIEGATVELAAEGMESVTMMTGADGTYIFNDLASGFYTVTKMPSEGMMPTTPPRIYVILVMEDGSVVSFLAANFGCMEGAGGNGYIKGLVWNDMNGDGKKTEDEPGVEGITVNLTGDFEASMVTDADGIYTFSNLVKGSYEVASVGPDGWVLTTLSPIQVVLESDDGMFNDAVFGWMEEASGGSGVISGLVWNDLNGDGAIDEGETGVEGIVVNLTGDATATATTAADGTYAFNELTAGEYVITSVGPDGWVLTTASPINVMLGSDDAVFDLGIFGWMEEASGGSGVISGLVWNDLNGDGAIDEGETGVEGIVVNLTGDATATATTAADGTYAFNELTAGEYVITSVGPDGWVLTTASPINVMLGSDDAVFDLGIFGWMEEASGGSGVISGLVWNDLNGDGAIDEGETGVEGIVVNLTGDATATATTAADGTYAFNELTAGEYVITSVGPDGWVLTTASPINVMLGSDDAVFDLGIFGWMEEATGGMASIGGIVFNDMNGNKVQDEGEPGVEGIKVDMLGDGVASVSSGANGVYLFTGLGLGNYELRSNGPDGWVVTTDEVVSVSIETADQVVDNAHFGWMEEVTVGKASIGGIVFNDMNGNKVQDIGEPGIEGIKVDLAGDGVSSVNTGADGSYLFTELGLGNYVVQSNGTDGWVVTTGETIPVKIETVDQVVDDADFGWMEESSGGQAFIGGIVFNDMNGNKVQDEGEPGVEGISVRLNGTSEDMTTSAADGSYSFTGLGMGEYKVQSVGPEGWVVTTDDELTVKIETAEQVVDNAHFGWMEEAPTN